MTIDHNTILKMLNHHPSQYSTGALIDMLRDLKIISEECYVKAYLSI